MNAVSPSEGSTGPIVSVASATPAMIYPATGPSTLLSRSWNLFRGHLKQSVLLMMIPAILDAINGIIVSIPASLPTLTGNYALIGSAVLLSYGLFFVLLVMNSIIRLFFLVPLSRIYYRAILYGESLSISEAFTSLRNRWFPFLVLFGLITVAIAAFWIVDIILLWLGIAGVAALGIFFAVLIPTMSGSIVQFLILAGAIVAVLIAGAILGFILIALASLQGALCFMPVVSAANSRKEKFTEVFDTFFGTYRLIFRHFHRVGIFGFLLFLLYMVLSIAISLPVQVWYIVELIFNADKLANGMIPFHFSVIANVYAMITSTIIWPFIFAAITLFWYDCRVRSEGLDLRLQVYRLHERLKEKQNPHRTGAHPF